jgi:hypothetical protein
VRSGKSRPGRRPPNQATAVSAAAIWAEPRSLFFFRTARLSGPEGEAICQLLALAESGAVLGSAASLAPLDRCTLELNSVHCLGGSITWVEEDRAGLEFDDRDQVREVLSGRQLSYPYRAPRLGLRCTLEVSLGVRRLKAQCHDISEGGIKVALAVDNIEGAEAIVALDGFGPVAGRVQWCRGGRAGISFEQPIPARDFTRWVTPRLEALAL